MYRALIDFSGIISMQKGETKDISDTLIVNDLVRAGYIEEVKPAQSEEKPKKRAKAK